MPDHFHMLANPLGLDVSVVAGRLKGRSASLILKSLRAEGHVLSLTKLALPVALESGQTHAVWLKEFSAIDIWSHKVHPAEAPLYPYESGARRIG
jgi:REP element-mobilizing transposase RayT